MAGNNSKDERKDPFTVSDDLLLGLGINHCPAWLVKAFIKKARERYGRNYWPLLMDIWRKAEAYDAFIGTGEMDVPGFDTSVPPPPPEEKTVKTLTGDVSPSGEINVSN